MTKLSFNEKNVLRLMESTFTGRLTFLSELMQNSRRAGASYVQIDCIQHPDGTFEFIVGDDGAGIPDFTPLMVVAESGWNEEIQKEEKPFGAGFLSAILSCKQGKVFSEGKVMSWEKDSILAGGDFDIQGEPSVLIGTTVQLEGVVLCQGKHDVERFVERHARGFPIRVTYNGKEVKRSHSVDKYRVKKVVENFGTICVNSTDSAVSGIQYYLQGLPIQNGGGEYSQVVVHLDSQRWNARMPDRAVLIDVTDADLDREVLDHCSALAELMSELYEGDLSNEVRWGFVSVYNVALAKQAVSIPANLFSIFSQSDHIQLERTIQEGDDEKWETTFYCSGGVSAEAFSPDSGIWLLSDLPDRGEDHQVGAAMLLNAVDEGKFLTYRYGKRPAAMPDWVPQAIEVDFESDLSAEPEGGAESVEVSVVSMPFASDVLTTFLCGSAGFRMTLKVADPADTTKEIIIASEVIQNASWWDNQADKLYVHCNGLGTDVLFYTDDYTESTNDYDTNWDEDRMAQDIQLANLAIEDAFEISTPEEADAKLAKMLEGIVGEALARFRDRLQGRSFTVQYPVNGWANPAVTFNPPQKED